MNILVILLIIFSSTFPRSSQVEVVDTVDLIEYNHRYNENGNHSYNQIIFYEWSPDFLRFDVVDWVLVDLSHGIKTNKNYHTNYYIVTFKDNESRHWRTVKAKLFRETWTDVDPERLNKYFLDEKYRTGLTKYDKTKEN